MNDLGVDRKNAIKAEYTGEKRTPKKGEWYLSGAQVSAYRAPNDLSQEFHIAKLVLAGVVQAKEEMAMARRLVAGTADRQSAVTVEDLYFLEGEDNTILTRKHTFLNAELNEAEFYTDAEDAKKVIKTNSRWFEVFGWSRIRVVRVSVSGLRTVETVTPGDVGVRSSVQSADSSVAGQRVAALDDTFKDVLQGLEKLSAGLQGGGMAGFSRSIDKVIEEVLRLRRETADWQKEKGDRRGSETVSADRRSVEVSDSDYEEIAYAVAVEACENALESGSAGEMVRDMNDIDNWDQRKCDKAVGDLINEFRRKAGSF